jgi:hypothetical protein
VNTGRAKKFLDAIAKRNPSTIEVYGPAIRHFNRYLQREYPEYDYTTIIDALKENKVDVYDLLDGFSSYLQQTIKNIKPSSLKAYSDGLRSYFGYYDIEITPSKFKRKVFLPRVKKEEEYALDKSEIRTILQHCNNRRLKSYLLILSSAATRETETASIRLKDINFYSKPTIIHLREDFTKTQTARDIYISDEATVYLKEWIAWKADWNNRNKDRIEKTLKEKGIDISKTFTDDDLIFTQDNQTTPQMIYQKLVSEFNKIIELPEVGLGERKDNGNKKRHKVVLHSLRGHAKSVIANQTNTDYSEWFLGHSGSPYYKVKEDERRKIYLEKCMSYVTFLDYTALDLKGKSHEAKLEGLEAENQMLRETLSELKQEFSSVKPWMLNMEKRYNEMLASGKVKPLGYKKRKVSKEFIEKLKNSKHDLLQDVTVLEVED